MYVGVKQNKLKQIINLCKLWYIIVTIFIMFS